MAKTRATFFVGSGSGVGRGEVGRGVGGSGTKLPCETKVALSLNIIGSLLAITMAMATKTSVEKVTSFDLYNLVISHCCLAEDGKEMYKNIIARAELLFLLIKPIVLWRSRCRHRCRCLSSLMFVEKPL